MLETIETRLSDAQGLLSLVAYEYSKGEKAHAAEELKEALARLLVVAREIEREAQADDTQLVYIEPVGVVAVPVERDKWQEREDAVLIRPQGHAVRVDGWLV